MFVLPPARLAGITGSREDSVTDNVVSVIVCMCAVRRSVSRQLLLGSLGRPARAHCGFLLVVRPFVAAARYLEPRTVLYSVVTCSKSTVQAQAWTSTTQKYVTPLGSTQKWR